MLMVSAVLCPSLWPQFSGTMKQAAVSELEGVLGQISKLLKEAKATFRKNR